MTKNQTWILGASVAAEIEQALLRAGERVLREGQVTTRPAGRIFLVECDGSLEAPDCEDGFSEEHSPHSPYSCGACGGQEWAIKAEALEVVEHDCGYREIGFSGPHKYGCPAAFRRPEQPYCNGWVTQCYVLDLTETVFPEPPELPLPYIARVGQEYVFSGDPELAKLWTKQWAPNEGLTDIRADGGLAYARR